MDDQSLAELIRAGSEEGYRHLLEVVTPRLKGALMKRFGGQHETHIEDALAEAIKTVWLRADLFDADKGSMPTWLLAIAGNAMRTTLRTRAARPLLEEVGHRDLEQMQVRRGGTDTRSEQQTKLLEDLRASIAQLSPMQQDIVMSDLGNGQSTSAKELATRWNTTDNVIRVSRHKAHKRIHDLMRKLQ